jgi:hypothetical protein
MGGCRCYICDRSVENLSVSQDDTSSVTFDVTEDGDEICSVCDNEIKETINEFEEDIYES